MTEKLREKLIPLYEKLIKDVAETSICTFCVQWGSKFPVDEKEGILFIGKATNGWYHSKNINELFGTNSANQIFNRDDQMKWVEENKVGGYNSHKSSFWRIIKRISQEKYNAEEWHSKVAWSNLYKISKETGNPSKKLQKQQIENCKAILKTEIEVLNPKFIVFLTSHWENPFFDFLTKTSKIEVEKNETWTSGKHQTTAYLIDGFVYIKSLHPQGKKEDEHIEAILKLMHLF
jgi:hypothetical protein